MGHRPEMPMRIAIAMMRTMQTTTHAFGRNVRARASAFACMLA